MPVSITSVVVRIVGTVAADMTAIAVDGAVVAIAADRTFSVDIALPTGATSVATYIATYVAITASGPARVETRLVAVERVVSAPVAAG